MLTGGDTTEMMGMISGTDYLRAGFRQRRGRAMLMADLVALWGGLSRLGCRQWLRGPLMN